MSVSPGAYRRSIEWSEVLPGREGTVRKTDQPRFDGEPATR